MRRLLLAIIALLGCWAMPLAAQEGQLPPEYQAMVDALTPQTGSVDLPQADARLDLGSDYIFYGPTDARTILVDIWGNHPDEANDVLGLVMPAGSSPLSDAWGAVVTYDATGWVSDEDARDADYSDLMAQMQEASAQSNAAREAQGFPAVSIVGWAQQPQYDSVNHSVVWARELSFDDMEVNTLNYDLRTLGRNGVLSINLIAAMPNLPEIRLAANDFATRASFNEGARYADYDASVDEAAGYGIAGLVAGGAGLAVAKKVGLLALLLKFIKPLLLGAVVLVGLFAASFKRLFGKGDEVSEEGEWSGEAEAWHAEPSTYDTPDRRPDLTGADRDDPRP